jgi:putative ABC transport system permease protein
MDTLVKDIRYAVRVLINGRGVTVIALLALTLGIGANTAIFSIVDGLLLKPLPFPQSDRLFRLYEHSPQSPKTPVSYPNYLDWRQQNQTFEDMSIFRGWASNITGAQGPERVQGAMVSASFLQVLKAEPMLGRTILPEDDKPGAPPVVVICYGLWQSRYAGDPNVLGQQLAVNGKDHTIIGILPADFIFYAPIDLFTPIAAQPNPALQSREARPGLRVIARLKPGVTPEQARADMDNLAAVLAQQYPKSNTGFGVTFVPLLEDQVGSVRSILLVLLGAVGFVLLIACANVANLLLVRATSRQKEIALRTALGATRPRLFGQLLTESVLLALVGGALGLLLASWSIKALVAAMPSNLPRTEAIGIDIRVLIFTLAASVLTGLVFGLVPALQSSKPDLANSLKTGGRTSTGGRSRVRNLLVVTEVALTLVLLIGAGLMIRSLVQLYSVDPGVNPKNVLTLKTPLSQARYNEAPKIRNFYEELLGRIKGVAGVESAALTADMPLTGAANEVQFWTGGQRPAPEGMSTALFCPVSAAYAQVMGVKLLKGRFISEQDVNNTPGVAVIDEHLARGMFLDEDPVGKRLTIQGFARMPDIVCEIVGVVGHVKHFGIDSDSEQKVQYQLYIPYLQVPDFLLTRMTESVTMVARTSTDPLTIAPEVKNQVLAIDKDTPLHTVQTMEQIVAASLSKQRFSMLLFGIFASVALVLAAIGIYGVMSYTVTQRTHEIGVRMALGAKRADVLKLVVRQGMTLAIIGLAIGIGAAFLLTRLMASLLFDVSTTDPTTFAMLAVLLAAVALLACYIPARRATKVDPMVALRYE